MLSWQARLTILQGTRQAAFAACHLAVAILHVLLGFAPLVQSERIVHLFVQLVRIVLVERFDGFVVSVDGEKYEVRDSATQRRRRRETDSLLHSFTEQLFSGALIFLHQAVTKQVFITVGTASVAKHSTEAQTQGDGKRTKARQHVRRSEMRS